MWWWILIGLIIWEIGSLAQFQLGRKLQIEENWLAFIPGLNLLHFFWLGGISSWGLLSIIFPPAFVVLCLITGVKIARQLGQNGCFGALLIIPPFNIAAWYYLLDSLWKADPPADYQAGIDYFQEQSPRPSWEQFQQELEASGWELSQIQAVWKYRFPGFKITEHPLALSWILLILAGELLFIAMVSGGAWWYFSGGWDKITTPEKTEISAPSGSVGTIAKKEPPALDWEQLDPETENPQDASSSESKAEDQISAENSAQSYPKAFALQMVEERPLLAQYQGEAGALELSYRLAAPEALGLVELLVNWTPTTVPTEEEAKNRFWVLELGSDQSSSQAWNPETETYQFSLPVPNGVAPELSLSIWRGEEPDDLLQEDSIVLSLEAVTWRASLFPWTQKVPKEFSAENSADWPALTSTKLGPLNIELSPIRGGNETPQMNLRIKNQAPQPILLSYDILNQSGFATTTQLDPNDEMEIPLMIDQDPMVVQWYLGEQNRNQTWKMTLAGLLGATPELIINEDKAVALPPLNIEQSLGSCENWHQKLLSCEPYRCEFQELTGYRTITREILGVATQRCEYLETSPTQQLACRYDEDWQSVMAQYYEDWQKDLTRRLRGAESDAGFNYQAGVVISSAPLQDAKTAEICRQQLF